MTFLLDPTLERVTAPVAALPLSIVRLHRDANYPWLILVPARPDLVELTDLDEPSLNMLMSEVRGCATALQTIFVPDKINIAALGNQVRQLHVHVIARKIGDAAWPKPVWGVVPSISYEEAELAELAHRIAVTLA